MGSRSDDFRAWHWMFWAMLFVACWLAQFRQYWRIPERSDVVRGYWIGRALIDEFKQDTSL